MRIEFLKVAETELNEAIAYYNSQSEGLGFEFAAEIKRTLERIVLHPDAWMPISERSRRCRTNRFPYAIIYQLRDETILIVAVMHLSRDPIKWEKRLKTL